MNLRDQLKEVLPDILPANPAESIKGTELIRLVKYSLRQEYSDATLRYHFSILCCDPSSPIAKVDQGQGYYLRQNRMATLKDTRTLAAAGFAGNDLFQSGRDAVDTGAFAGGEIPRRSSPGWPRQTPATRLAYRRDRHPKASGNSRILWWLTGRWMKRPNRDWC